MNSDLLKLYVNEDEYNTWRNQWYSQWPTYDNYLKGHKANDASVQEALDEFVKDQIDSGITFPIKQQPACLWKWTWSTIYLNRLKTASCHRTQLWPIDINNFDNFHNVPEKIKAREKMLNGEWPGHGCEYCRDIENAGGLSDRVHSLTRRNAAPVELITNPTATSVTPRVVEIFAQNTCNFSCVYCNDSLSSRIQQENIKYGAFKSNGVSIPVYPIPETTKEVFDKFITWIDNNIQQLTRLHLLGGETFLQHDLMTQILDIIERKPNPDMTLCVFSNLNVPEKYWNLYLGRIKDLASRGHIQKMDLTASIDCWGPQQEYVRSGLDLVKFEERMAWACEQGSWLHLNINQTVTAMTIKTMPDLIKKIAHYSKIKNIGHWFQFYTGPHMFQHPKIFSYQEWATTFDEIYVEMRTDTYEQRDAIPRMQGLQRLLEQQTENDWEGIGQLQTYLDELDRRRGTNWRDLFPHIDVAK
jgi:hypothetical protein